METALKAIAEPRRRAILRLVRDDELSAGEIASHFDVTRPAVSQHLTLLKEAGLVDERRNGTRRLYRARPEGLAELKAFLEEFWDDRLEALKREAEREERKKDGDTTEQIVFQREIADRGLPGDGVGVPRRPGEAGPLVGPARRRRSTRARRRVPHRGHPGAASRAGEFVELEPPRRLVYTWGWEPGGDGPNAVPPGSSTVEIELVPDGRRDEAPVHAPRPAERASRPTATRVGWDHYLGRLAIAAAGGDPGPDPWLAGAPA